MSAYDLTFVAICAAMLLVVTSAIYAIWTVTQELGTPNDDGGTDRVAAAPGRHRASSVLPGGDAGRPNTVGRDRRLR